MDRRELAAFLRSRRERLAPADCGLPVGPRRRTPGLRREEVAAAAFISTEYYTRLEQARGPRPSHEVLAGLARALRLSAAERDHLHHLAGTPPGPPAGPSRVVGQDVLDLLRRLPQAAAILLSATYEVLAWNDLAVTLLGDFSTVPRADRNLLRRAFLAPQAAPPLLTDRAERVAFAGSMVRDLRATAARYPGDPEVVALLGDLRAGSPEFARLWADHRIGTGTPMRKTVDHPELGALSLHCDALAVPGRDQRLVIYTAEPGSREAEALRMSSANGTHHVHVPG